MFGASGVHNAYMKAEIELHESPHASLYLKNWFSKYKMLETQSLWMPKTTWIVYFFPTALDCGYRE